MNLLVGTRKGLFTFTREAAGWQPVAESFLGDPIPMLLADRRDGTWYAVVEHGHFGTKLHRSDDRGQQWEELDAPRFPAKPDDVPDTLNRPLWDMPERAKWCGGGYD